MFRWSQKAPAIVGAFSIRCFLFLPLGSRFSVVFIGRKYRLVHWKLHTLIEQEHEEGNLSYFSFNAIIRLIHRVAYKLTMKCENVQKKVGGKVLNLPEFVAYDQAKAEGEMSILVSLVCRKIQKGKNVLQIAEDLDEDVDEIEFIFNIAAKYAPDYDADRVLKAVLEKKKNSQLQKF